MSGSNKIIAWMQASLDGRASGRRRQAARLAPARQGFMRRRSRFVEGDCLVRSG